MRAGLRWLVVGLLLSTSSLGLARQTTLRDVRLWASAAKTRVVFDLADDTDPNLFRLAHPQRLVVDLADTRAASRLAGDLDGGGVVAGMRTGVRHGHDLRVVLDLTDKVATKSFMLSPRDGHRYRLVIDLRSQTPSKPSAPRAKQSGHSVATAERAAVAQAAAADSARQQQAAGRGEARQRGKPIVIAVDAGHGGKDPGAHGPHGLREKTVTLAIARRLAAMIDDQPNMRAVLTRKTDRYIGLRERTVEARKAKADLFISIHADAAPHGGRARGASVYALSKHGATSEHARWLAKRENAADLVGGVSLKNKNDSLASFMLDLSQSASIEASLDAGKRVLKRLDALGPLHKSRVQQAGFMVLKSPDIPSFLVETGFISDPRGEHKLDSTAYRKKLARAMLQGIKGYFASYRPSTLIAKGQTHAVERGETLSGIAQRYGSTVARLRAYNALDDNTIRIGQTLQIPPPGHQQVAGLR